MTDEVGESEVVEVLIDGSALGLDALDGQFGRRLTVGLTEAIWGKVDGARERVSAIVSRGDAVYGVNTGFGNLCRKRVDANDLDKLQYNLIRSHAVGVGPKAPPEVVRWMLLFKIAALSQGYSGVQRSTIGCLCEMLGADVLPVVPNQGSLGASGDLAPLAHMVLPLIGEGKVAVDGVVMSAGEAFRSAGIEQVTLGPKEGLALINGTQFMSAYGAAILVRARRAVKQADVIASMSLEALRGSIKPFDARLHEVRPHPGAIETAENFRSLLRGSEVLASHADCDKVQDPYSLRCIPQVHGAIRDVVRHASEVVEREINSVTDNPVIFEDGSAISGGNFHGESIAMAMDYLAIALCELASISERRIYLLLSGHDGLPLLLMRDTGLNSGFMLPQYTAAALVSESKIFATPASVDSIPTSLGQEDHVSMGATAATKAWRVMNSVETVLAIEQMCAAQGMDYRAPLKAGVGPQAALETVRERIGHTEEDRLFGDDIEASLDLFRSCRMLERVEAVAGKLS